MHQQIHITWEMKDSLWWWTHVEILRSHRPIMPLQAEVVKLDGSLSGWGAHYQDQTAQGLGAFNND